MTDLRIRSANADDAGALFALISAHAAEGHLLPRSLDELVRHAPRFLVAEAGGELMGCAELAPLSARVAEVDRKSTRLNSSHMSESRMPSSA